MTINDRTAASPTVPRPTVRLDGPRLVAEDLVVLRGGHRVLGGVSLSLAPDELVAVVGASGAGKSTLLASLAGLTDPASGSVALVDRSNGSSRSPYGAVGLVPQDDILHADLPLRAPCCTPPDCGWPPTRPSCAARWTTCCMSLTWATGPRVPSAR